MNAQLNLPDPFSGMLENIDRAINMTIKSRLDALAGKQVLFSPDDKEFIPINGWKSDYEIEITRISEVRVEAYTVGIDSSSVFIGNTDDGAIYASKCGIAFSLLRKPFMHFRIGPMVHYIRDDYFRDKRLARLAMLDRGIIKRMIRVRMERAVQSEISRNLLNSLILIDGSLKLSIFEDGEQSLHTIVDNCASNNNMLLGISKTTRLKFIEQMASVVGKHDYPCYSDASSLKMYISNLIGRPLLAKLSSDGIVLRVDVVNDPSQSLGVLLANDLLYRGYPETLRLAHHLSVFTRTDLLSIMGFIKGRLGVNEVAGEDVRSRLLGIGD